MPGWSIEVRRLARGEGLADYSAHAERGIRVLVLWVWDVPVSSGGDGIFGQRPLQTAATIARAIKRSRGVWGHIIGTRLNDPQAWHPEAPITVDLAVQLYDLIGARVGGDPRLAVGSVDPTLYVSEDPLIYWRQVLSQIHRKPDFVAVPGHSYGVSQSIIAPPKFDLPLSYQWYGFRMWEAFADAHHAQFGRLPVIVTGTLPDARVNGSTNHWQNATEWIPRVLSYVQNQRPDAQGVIFDALQGMQQVPGVLTAFGVGEPAEQPD